MTVFHCPACPLIFEHRTEVEYHLRNDHRSRADEEADLATQPGDGRELDWGRLRTLQSARRSIAITISMGTTPSGSMTGVDVASLRRLANQARRRLATEPSAVPVNLDHRLARAVAAAEGSPTQEGLVLLVDVQELAIFHLPFEPVDRVVIDPGFATRDLEATLRWYPLYRLVALGRRPRLFEGRGAHLVEVDDETKAADTHSTRDRDGKRAIRPERWMLDRARRQTGVRLADQMIAERVETRGEAPLVVAGDGRWRAEFRRRSRHAPSVITEIPGVRVHDPASALGERAEIQLARRRRHDQARAVAELEEADGYGSVVWGPRAVWTAVTEGFADALWVERGYAPAGRPLGDGSSIDLVASADKPGIIDDLVDDLIQAAATKQAEIHLLADGATGRPEPIAARLRTGARHPTRAGLAQAV